MKRHETLYRRKSDFEAASAILSKAFKKYGIEDKLNRYKFVARWPEIMGEGIARRSRPEYINNKVLYVKVSDSTWAQELNFQKNIILKRLERYLDKDSVVKDIRFIVGPL